MHDWNLRPPGGSHFCASKGPKTKTKTKECSREDQKVSTRLIVPTMLAITIGSLGIRVGRYVGTTRGSSDNGFRDGLGLNRKTADNRVSRKTANPYGRAGCAPLWAFFGMVLWFPAFGVRSGFLHHRPSAGAEGWGGRIPGPTGYAREGRLGPSDLSPDAPGWITPDVTGGHRASGNGVGFWGKSGEQRDNDPTLGAQQGTPNTKSQIWHWDDERKDSESEWKWGRQRRPGPNKYYRKWGKRFKNSKPKEERRNRKAENEGKKRERQNRVNYDANLETETEETRTQRRDRKRKGRKEENRKRDKQKTRGRSIRKLILLRKTAEGKRGATKKRGKLRGATWNVRRLGAIYGTICQNEKMECILNMCEARRWQFCLLTDLAFKDGGVREYAHKGNKWTLIIRGRVGILLNQQLAAGWRIGGAEVRATRRKEDQNTRSMAIRIRIGRGEKDVVLIVNYAPTSSATVEERQRFRDDISKLIDDSGKRCRLIIGGDFNAEVGRRDTEEWEVVGPCGITRRTDTGRELIKMCKEEDLVIANTFFKQKQAGTWKHIRYGTQHTLDMFLLPRAQRNKVRQCKALHFGTRMEKETRRQRRKRKKKGKPEKPQTYRLDGATDWALFTDHDPVEISICVKKQYKDVKTAKAARGDQLPAYSKIQGNSDEAGKLREKLAEEMEKELGRQDDKEWEWTKLSKISQAVAQQVLGVQERPHPNPWIQGHEQEKRQLDAEVTDAMNDRWRIMQDEESENREERLRLSKQKLRKVRRKRQRKRREWEMAWWKNLGIEATEAAKSGDQGRLFQVINSMLERRKKKLRDGGTATTEDVEKEREAWKEHFQKISEGRAEVKERVWKNIKKSGGNADWLGKIPSDIELEIALGKMKLRKKPGKDQVPVEILKYGGKQLRQKVFGIVQEMWASAAVAETGEEAKHWPRDWKEGITIPLWKKKGSRADKNTWRGITLLSVGSKLLARVVAKRIQEWSEAWISEEQCGFRRGRGVDDSLMVSRRISEEVNRTVGSDWILMSFFDIEKAYPKVCKDGLWKLMELRGAPPEIIKVCRALHEHTKYRVRIFGGESTAWLPDRGLREGCPSSPPLFNIYHDGVMEDFRERRKQEARKRKQEPGIRWSYKIDGRMVKLARLRTIKEGGIGFSSEVQHTTIGDTGFADDTAIVGEEEEVRIAERILEQVTADWAEKLHPDKTERLRITGGDRPENETKGDGEKKEVRHVGGWVAETGRHNKDTDARASAGWAMVKKIAWAWASRSRRGRGRESGIDTTTKLQIMKQTVVPTLTAFARSRAWNGRQLNQLERVAKYAVRRAFGMDIYAMREHHVSDEMMYKASGWLTMEDTIRRLTLEWVGHVARMPTDRRPKQMLFGWWQNKKSKICLGVIMQPMWLRRIVRQAGIPAIDWFRLAQDRKEWRKLIQKAIPQKSLTKEQKMELDQWMPGLPLPGISLEEQGGEGIISPEEGEEEEREASEEEEGEVEEVAEQRGEEGKYQCPVCSEEFKAGNQLQYHYDAEHSVRDPDIVTVLSKQCEFCRTVFARKDQLYKHIGWTLNWKKEPTAEPCEAKAAGIGDYRLKESKWEPVQNGPALPPPKGWWIATDGSGQTKNEVKSAGWGVAIWRIPVEGDTPDYMLYGPVITKPWDHRWLGARERTNNTAELSAIIEACLWLRDEAPDSGGEPVMLRYDSQYAANISLGRYTPKTNKELAETAKRMMADTMSSRNVTTQHVYGHTGAVDNEVADRLADKGAKGEIAADSRRWAAPRGTYEAVLPIPEVQHKIKRPNRAAHWAAKREGRPAPYSARLARAAAKAKAEAKARAKGKAKAKPTPKSQNRPKAKAKAKTKGKAKGRGKGSANIN